MHLHESAFSACTLDLQDTHDKTHHIALQARKARQAAGLQEASSDEAGHVGPPALPPELRAKIQDAIDCMMRASEESLLTARALLGHSADAVAFAYGLPVPVHPSQQEDVGAKTQERREVCPMLKRAGKQLAPRGVEGGGKTCIARSVCVEHLPTGALTACTLAQLIAADAANF